MCEEISYSVMPDGKVDNGELVLKQECRSAGRKATSYL